MSGLKRRTLLQASVAAAGVLAAPQIKAQSKPEKLVYVGDNGPWHWVMVEEVAPAFEKATGIKIDFTLLPVDPWRARLRAELGAGSSGIDIVQWSVGMAGWIAPHMEDHEPLLAQIKARRCRLRLERLPHRHEEGGDLRRQAVRASRTASPPASSTTSGRCWSRPGSAKPPGTWDEFLKTALAVNKPPDRYAFGIFGLRAPACIVGFTSLAVFQRRAAARLQDRRDLHQRRQGASRRCSSMPIWSPNTKSCRRRR